MAKNAVKTETVEKPKVDHRAIEKSWKQGAHAHAADLIVEGGRDAFNGLIKAIPEDERLIRETLAERGVY